MFSDAPSSLPNPLTRTQVAILKDARDGRASDLKDQSYSQYLGDVDVLLKMGLLEPNPSGLGLTDQGALYLLRLERFPTE